MLNSLRKVGRELGQELSRAWDNLSEGWRELLSRTNNALTHFRRDAPDEAAGFPNWSLLAGEVEETPDAIVVRVELPGMEKDDCEVVVEDNVLYVRGEKRYQRESETERYHVLERAYGHFERAVPLPKYVDADKAQAHYKSGVLTVRLPKAESAHAKRVPVN